MFEYCTFEAVMSESPDEMGQKRLGSLGLVTRIRRPTARLFQPSARAFRRALDPHFPQGCVGSRLDWPPKIGGWAMQGVDRQRGTNNVVIAIELL